jgi:putative thiazole-containing bacteriocin maturation protein
LKSDTFYIPVEDGVYLRNNEKSFVLKGKTVASWMERLAPLLNGSYDLEDLCQRVPVEKRPMIEKLVGILAEHGYVKDTALDQPHTLTDDIQQTYGPAIAYIDYHLDSGAYRFQQFLDLPVLAMGSGDALVALAHALLETGNRQIHLLDTHEETTDYGRINELLAILQADRDASLSLHTLTLGGWDDEHLLAALAPFKVVIYFTACGSLALVNRLAAVCYRAGVIFLPAVTLENEIIIGPTQKPNTTGCWQCFWRRRQSARGLSTLDEHGSPALPPAFSVSPSQPGGTAIAVAANLLAFEFFKQGTGIHTETLDGQVFVLEMERLQSVTHTVFAHPLCRICAPLFSTVSPDSVPQAQWVCDEIAALRCYQSALEPRELAQQVEQWVDAYCGIFTRLNEQDYYQLPLVRSQVTIAAPSSEGTLPKVSAAALDYQEARLILVREALSLYLSSLADSRRTIRASYEQLREHH